MRLSASYPLSNGCCKQLCCSDNVHTEFLIVQISVNTSTLLIPHIYQYNVKSLQYENLVKHTWTSAVRYFYDCLAETVRVSARQEPENVLFFQLAVGSIAFDRNKICMSGSSNSFSGTLGRNFFI